MDKPDKCMDCNFEFPIEERGTLGACPECGSTRRRVSASITENIVASDSLKYESRREFYEKNNNLHYFIIAIAIISPLIGLAVAGVWGVIVGIILSAISYFLGPKALIKVREIERG